MSGSRRPGTLTGIFRWKHLNDVVATMDRLLSVLLLVTMMGQPSVAQYGFGFQFKPSYSPPTYQAQYQPMIQPQYQPQYQAQYQPQYQPRSQFTYKPPSQPAYLPRNDLSPMPPSPGYQPSFQPWSGTSSPQYPRNPYPVSPITVARPEMPWKPPCRKRFFSATVSPIYHPWSSQTTPAYVPPSQAPVGGGAPPTGDDILPIDDGTAPVGGGAPLSPSAPVPPLQGIPDTNAIGGGSPQEGRPIEAPSSPATAPSSGPNSPADIPPAASPIA